MSEYMFKTYIANGKEYFIYSDDVSDDRFTKKIDFPFSESLFSLLDLDIWKREPQIKKIDRALLNLYRTRDARYTEDVFFTLQSLSDVHIFFKLLFLDWSKRLNEAEKDKFAHASDMLPHKAIAHIPSNIDYAQKQIKDLLERVLDMDASKRSVSSRFYDYYKDPYHVDPRPFEFQPLTVSFEMIDRNAYAEVLYPKSIYDLIDYYLREWVRREQKMRVCKNCGKYFAITGRTNAEYCDRVFDSKGRTCKDVGAIAKWTREKDTDDVFKAYRREYKKRFAWTKSGKILPEELYAWGERAREKKAECDSGKITLEEYTTWLKES